MGVAKQAVLRTTGRTAHGNPLPNNIIFTALKMSISSPIVIDLDSNSDDSPVKIIKSPHNW